jgi:hypothetical protein
VPAGPGRGRGLSTSRNDKTIVFEKMAASGLKQIHWAGRCDAEQVSIGTYDVPEGEGGMYALVFDNTFSENGIEDGDVHARHVSYRLPTESGSSHALRTGARRSKLIKFGKIEPWLIGCRFLRVVTKESAWSEINSRKAEVVVQRTSTLGAKLVLLNWRPAKEKEEKEPRLCQTLLLARLHIIYPIILSK